MILAYYHAPITEGSHVMRGADEQSGSMFSYVSLEQRVPADHPLRAIRRITDRALAQLSPRFGTLYIHFGRPSIPPEQLLRALLLQVLYTIRSERQLMEQLDYNLLYRWFVGLGIDDGVWSATTFSKNRDRLLDGEIAAAFFEAVRLHAETEHLLSHDHFTVDGTLLEAWASHKSFTRRETPPDPPAGGGNPTVNFRGERRSNRTHQSTTDPDARLAKKGVGRPAQLAYGAHVLMENRSGLIMHTCVLPADGYGERDAALIMAAAVPGGRITLGMDKGYDTPAFIAELRHMGVTPHVAQNTAHRRSAIDHRTTRHAGYAVSQRKRKLVEQIFGWWKSVGGLRKLRHRGGALVTWIVTFTAAVYNIVRLRRLLPAGAA
jgi:transposase